ncbi:MAG: ABC transporter permease [Bacilli bacterium]|nr:ABC transporter permease [Bacilli bacterium]
MGNKLKYLIGVSLNKKIKTKWFAIVNIILVIVIIGLINIDSVINFFGGNFGGETKITVVDNTEQSFDIFAETLQTDSVFDDFDTSKIEVIKSDKTEEEEIDAIKDNKRIVIILNKDEEEVLTSKIIVESNIETILQQKIIAAINTTKSSLAMIETNIKIEDLMKINAPASIERIYLDETKTEASENMRLVMSVVFPIVILPFFMLIIILVQMLGAEINEEKTTRGMEIIISNVSPRTHFLSKIIASNIFVFLQGGILLFSGMIGLLIRRTTNKSGSLLPEGIDLNAIWEQLIESGFAEKMLYIIPLVILLLFLSFLAYSLLAGILASMTTSMEDYQQLQTPIIFISLAGYYLSMMAPLFEGSIFIRFISYIPFLSALLSPALLLIGQIGIIDITISVTTLLLLIYLMSTYGLKIYKVGILNYSTSKLWTKMYKAIKE